MHPPPEIQWSGVSLRTEMKVIAFGNLVFGVFLVGCSASYADIIFSPDVIAPCTELSNLEVARRLLKVLFFISTIGGIEAVLSASLMFAIYKRIMPIIMLWIVTYTCIIATVTGSVVVFCYILLTQGVQTGDTGTLMFLLTKLGFMLFSLLITHKFYSTLTKQRHYVSVSTIGTLPGWRI